MIELEFSTDIFPATDALAKRLKDFSEPLGEIGAFLERKARQRFVTETDPEGRKWAPLRPSTLRRKKPGLPILTDKGNLRASLAALPPSKTRVIVKPGVDYGIFHQTGTVKMVARPFLGFEKGDPDAIAKIINRYLSNA